MKRIVALDGTRALAFLLVFLHHAGAFLPGWFGVDYFFVLSGYLITSVLIEQRERESGAGQILRTFYIRRAKRILPPLAFAILLAVLLRDPTVAHDWPWYVTFTANFGKAMGDVRESGLGVLWSLAIEEHFYLVFPFLFLLLSRRALITVLSITVLAEPLLRLLFTLLAHGPHSYLWIYFTTPFRLDAIALGCLLAIVFHKNPDPAAQRRTAVGLIVGGALVLALCSRDTRFFREANGLLFNSVGYSLIALISAGVLLWIVTEPHGVVSRLLSQRALVWIGSISYTAYLIHAVMMFGLRQWLGDAQMHHHEVRYRLFTLPATLLVAAGSWYLLERPILTAGRVKPHSLPQVESADAA